MGECLKDQRSGASGISVNNDNGSFILRPAKRHKSFVPGTRSPTMLDIAQPLRMPVELMCSKG
jgi:hypothetical protein